MGSQGATCFHTLTSDARDIPKDQWDDMRFGQICTIDPPDKIGATFSDWKSVIEQLCSLSGRCDYPTRQQISDFFDRVEIVTAQVKKLKGGSR